MMHRSPFAIALVLLVFSCSPKGTPDAPSTEAPPALKEATGRITFIDGSNAPDTALLSPPIVRRTPAFVAANGGGSHGSSTGKPLIRTHTTDDGLPVDAFWCGTIDRNGMLWFGSNGGGLVRYDGRSFTTFGLSNGLSDVVVISMKQDRAGNLWLGTSMGGLCKYDGRSFTRWSEVEGFRNKGVTSILEDRNGMMWFGTRGEGLSRFNGKSFTTYRRKDGLLSNYVHEVVEDQAGALWIGGNGGLSRFDGNTFVNYTPANGLPCSSVWTMFFAADGALWIGGGDGDVARGNVGADGTVSFTHCIRSSAGLGRINTILQTPEGDIWIATENSGAVRISAADLNKEAPEFTRFTTAVGLASNAVEGIVVDRSGDLWFCTFGGGLCQFRGNAFVNFLGTHAFGITEDRSGALWLATADGAKQVVGGSLTAPVDRLPGNNTIYAVSMDRQGGVLWGDDPFSEESCAFSVLDGDTYTVHPTVPGDEFSYVFWVMEDSKGSIWKAGNGGACRYDGLGDGVGPVRRVKFTAKQGLPNDIVLGMHEDRAGNMWFGTDGGGLSRFNGTSFTTWAAPGELPNGVVWSIEEDAGGNIWCSTFSGICRFDGRSFANFSRSDGLPDNAVTQLLLTRPTDEPARGAELCVGTMNGLAILTGWLNSEGDTIPFSGTVITLSNEELRAYTPVFEVYNPARGYPIKDSEDGQHALFEDSEGIIWAGTGSSRTGLVRFDRKALTRHDPRPPTIVLEGIAIRNEPINWYDLDHSITDSATLVHQQSVVHGKVLSAHERHRYRSGHAGISFTGIEPFFAVPEGLVLSHANNRIDFDFVGVETSSPEQVEYQFMLEGYDTQWGAATHASTASFGNISEGDYTFKVKAKSPSGVWSEALEYRFTVLPPWWRTWWAYSLYVLVLGGGVLAYVRVRIVSLKRQQRKLARLVDRRTEELQRKKKEADQQRSRAEHSEKAKEQFLANMSHEIRTPMNAIMGMTGILQREQHPPTQDRYLDAIAQSSENLLVILNDILDMSKIDAGKIGFEEVPFEPRRVIGNVKEILQFKAEEKKLALTVEVAGEVPATLLGDPTRLHQIVLNLAGNAVKFTERGSVTIRVRCSVHPSRAESREGRPEGVALAVDVIDTGIGIPEDRLREIFEEFTQAYSDTTRKYGGTGLGLTISKRLAELQGGSITVKSERDKGSTFTVSIPYAIVIEAGATPGQARSDNASGELRDIRILLAEDNEFNVLVAQDALKTAIPGVQVDVAPNGRIAVDLAQANHYDIILMDVQMPEMNGYDATQAIRALAGDKSRAPILAMTANVMKEELDRCMEAGMNGYVPKPFKRQELVQAIETALSA